MMKARCPKSATARVPSRKTAKPTGFRSSPGPSPRTPTVRRVIVRPFVAAVVPEVTIVESPEVAAAFWVPLSALRETAAWITAEVVAHGQSLTVPAFAHGEYVVWGLTERILRGFLDLLDREAGESGRSAGAEPDRLA